MARCAIASSSGNMYLEPASSTALRIRQRCTEKWARGASATARRETTPPTARCMQLLYWADLPGIKPW